MPKGACDDLTRKRTKVKGITSPQKARVCLFLSIVVGWVLALGDVPPLRLTIPYLLGSTLLIIYSVFNWDVVFIALNGLSHYYRP